MNVPNSIDLNNQHSTFQNPPYGYTSHSSKQQIPGVHVNKQHQQMYHENFIYNGNNTTDAPLFQRNSRDDYTELQKCHNIMNKLQERVNSLESININLESRLEKEAKQNMNLERECILIENSWKLKCESLEKEIEKWKLDSATEKIKNEKLREHLSRTERELYGILQRKYELMRGSSQKGGKNTSPMSLNNGLGNIDTATIEDMYTTQQVRKSINGHRKLKS